MRTNRSMPHSTVIPELPYPDIGKGIDWLCAAFDFTLRIWIGNHRAQLNVGDGAVVLTERHPGEGHDSPSTHSVMTFSQSIADIAPRSGAARPVSCREEG